MLSFLAPLERLAPDAPSKPDGTTPATDPVPPGPGRRLPQSVESIRRFVRETIGSWGLRTFADDLTNAVNELTTNAVQHALLERDEQAKA